MRFSRADESVQVSLMARWPNAHEPREMSVRFTLDGNTLRIELDCFEGDPPPALLAAASRLLALDGVRLEDVETVMEMTGRAAM